MRVEMENDPEVIANPDGERAQDYGEDLNNLEEELDVLKEEAHDIYDIRYDEMDIMICLYLNMKVLNML